LKCYRHLWCDDVKYHDADATAFGYEYGQIPQMPVAFQSSKPLIEKVSQVVQQQQQLTAKVLHPHHDILHHHL
jgi:adenosylhomocysteine nucleosidase